MTLFFVVEIFNLTVFKLYYGTGEVRHGPNRVDLSSFPVTSLQVENPEGYMMKQMIKYLTRWFQLDMERYSMRVELLHTKPSTSRIWELAPVRTTTAWITGCGGAGISAQNL